MANALAANGNGVHFGPGGLARNTLALVLAGGRGSRLRELTDRRAKPAVHFGGTARIIDFALSNALNSGIRRIGVATQYKAHSLIRHLQRGWTFLRTERNESFDILPASQQVAEDQWYEGTADAVFQNLEIIERYPVEHVVVLAGDHVYKMDYGPMLEQHVGAGADVTVGCIEVPREQAVAFGVMRVDGEDRIAALHREAERPARHAGPARPGPGQHGHLRLRRRLPLRPAAAGRGRARLGARLRPRHHPLHRPAREGGGPPLLPLLRQVEPAAEDYWRDVGTLDAYFEANLDLTSVVPELNLYDRTWPIWTTTEMLPPAKFVHDVEGRRGQATASLVSNGCIVSGARVRNSLLATGVRVNSWAELDRAVILPYVEVGRGARLRNVIVDSDVRIPPGLVVGEEPDLDARRFRRTEKGVCLITQAMLDRLG